jgi:hypothetical protein
MSLGIAPDRTHKLEFRMLALNNIITCLDDVLISTVDELSPL